MCATYNFEKHLTCSQMGVSFFKELSFFMGKMFLLQNGRKNNSVKFKRIERGFQVKKSGDEILSSYPVRTVKTCIFNSNPCGSNHCPIWTQNVPKEAWWSWLHTFIRFFQKHFVSWTRERPQWTISVSFVTFLSF